jgi:hypothetical protein
LAHIVFFSLRDAGDEAVSRMVDECHEYLTGHDGTVYFSAGKLAAEFTRDVNDRDFDVALHVVFESKDAHDKYQSHPRHGQFITRNKPNWSRVRVFDSYV